jgi:hypothetical protein
MRFEQKRKEEQAEREKTGERANHFNNPNMNRNSPIHGL